MKKRSINVLGDPSPHGVEVVTVSLKRTFLILFCSLALAGCWIILEAGPAYFRIELQNSCNFPVQVTSPVDYLWSLNEPPGENDGEHELNPGEVAEIYSHFCNFCVPNTLHPFGYSDYALLKMNFQEDYTITIRANGQEQVLNSVQFLELVKRAKKKDDMHWIIKDPSLCPVAAEKD